MTKTNLSINNKEYIFVEKYRPTNIHDIIMTETLRSKVKEWIKDEEIPNILMSSKAPGLGKSSLAHVLIHELDAEALFINASLDSNIDTLRNKIKGFASTASFDGRAKIVVLDESDFLNANSAQPALRGFIEEFSKNCRFVLTCNYKDKIIEPIRNRLIEIDFDEMFNQNKKELGLQMFKRTKLVLENENIKYTPEDMKYLITHYYPSSRSVINKIQEFIQNIDNQKVLVINKDNIDTDTLNEKLMESIKSKDFKTTRENIEKLADPSTVFGVIYDRIDEFEQSTRPGIIITTAKYSAWDSQVRDRLVNAVACALEIQQQI